jgi:hypothetical protein
MVNELDLSQEKQCYYKERAEIVIKNLQRRNINGQYAANRAEALAVAMSLIPPEVSVVRGDSMSVEQIGLLDAIKKRNQNPLVDIFQRDANGDMIYTVEERYYLEREAFSADIFITGSNAVTLDGKILNTDGMGNRVAPMIFGPRKVILIIGANKIVQDEDEARRRIRDIAAPLNSIRHYMKHNRTEFATLPCVRTGKCVDCSHEERICRYTVVIEGASKQHKGRINVVLVGDDLGI